ncbi:MAG: glutathione S-transferase family protein [Gammaproteobacteria bacterium]|nr:glutathione S-transferase family protein [Gammaproteobacteria bacterium]MDH5304738.1 glutathione S-transferase family protein [Gammaproteobacteria bacterium]
MQLIGMFDSPFVRRVAITMRLLGVPFEHNPLSIFRGYDEFRKINPLVKVPTLICDDGTILVDSTLIIDYVEMLAGRSLLPVELSERSAALHLIGIALVAMEKTAQRIYELKQRPVEMQYAPWLERINEQLLAAIDAMEIAVSGKRRQWLVGAQLTQADIDIAVAWRFIRHAAPTIAVVTTRPALDAFGELAETLPEFIAAPL